jgi:hypothetical protein
MCMGRRDEYQWGVGSEVRLVDCVLEHAPRVALGCLEAWWLFEFSGYMIRDVIAKHSIV